MSTIDPAASRRHRDDARLGSPAVLFGVALGLALVGVGAALLARALFGFADFDSQTSQSFSGDVGESPLAITGMILGVPLVIVGFFVHSGASRRFSGRLFSSPGIGPGTVLLAGLAIGSWWGFFVILSLRTWVLLPVGLSILTAISFIIGVVARIRRRSRREMIGHLLAYGQIERGEITEIPEIDPNSGGLIGVVTVKFSDAAGTDRWVRKTGQWPRRELPAAGDPASVLYDPAHPADTSRIWVAPLGSATAADFTRWHT